MGEDEVQGKGVMIFVDKEGKSTELGLVGSIEIHEKGNDYQRIVDGVMAWRIRKPLCGRCSVRFKERLAKIRKALMRAVERGKYKYGHGERKRAAKEAARCLRKK